MRLQATTLLQHQKSEYNKDVIKINIIDIIDDKMELQKATGFLKNAYYQGHGRYVNQIVRLTIKFCKTGGGSREVRKFIETKLVDLARDNPGCVIYVKPRLYKAPVMKAEYINGESHHLSFYRMGEAQVGAWIDWFITRSGYELYKLQRSNTTYRPSVQGIWTPFYFRGETQNETTEPSTATEELIRRSISK